MNIASSTPVSQRSLIVAAARNIAKLTKGKLYIYGGKTTAGFDCSGYVTYVFKQVFPTFPGGIGAASFQQFGFSQTKDPKPGDLVCFPAGTNSYDKKTYPDHVGIVLDTATWIGSQSSTGVAEVKMMNPWWNGRVRKYLKYNGITG